MIKHTWTLLLGAMTLFACQSGQKKAESAGNADSTGTRTVWTAEQANNWYKDQPWLVGGNYITSSAINQLEMWQAETFDTAAVDRELGLAASIGMNSMRVCLHDLLYTQDPEVRI